MLHKRSVKKSQKKDFLFLVIQIHLLLFLLISVLWSMSFLKKGSPSLIDRLFPAHNQQQVPAKNNNFKEPARSATIIPPQK